MDEGQQEGAGPHRAARGIQVKRALGNVAIGSLLLLLPGDLALLAFGVWWSWRVMFAVLRLEARADQSCP